MEDFQKVISDCIEHLKNVKVPEKFTLVYSEAAYDALTEKFGDNCGWDRNKVEVLRGYPKFDDNGK